MEQLQLLQVSPPSEGRIVLGTRVQEQLVKLMAEMMLAIIVLRKEAADDRQSS